MKPFWSLFVPCLLSGAVALGENAPELRTMEDRLAHRDFPSVFQAWNPADNLPDEAAEVTLARHDLVFDSIYRLQLAWDQKPEGLATRFAADSLPRARKIRDEMQRRNPNQILLCEIRYRDAHTSFLPEDSPWWKRDESGKRVIGWEEGGYYLLDFANPEFQDHVAKRASAAMKAGFDGVMLDWWHEGDERLALIRKIRQAIGEEALILGNANDLLAPRSAPYLNGFFMECWRSSTPEDWARITETLRWAESHLREPRINCLETWFEDSRQDLAKMRATTTLVLTHSDGFCLFSDPNPLPTADHLHDWYPFWDVELGKPQEVGQSVEDGTYQRKFENALVVHNPVGNSRALIEFEEPRIRASNREHGRKFHIDPSDGDFFLLAK
tara:strand:+ start:16345 stop:17496 length:1152 start_codon:yes stop_codon:yes gene_type:complete